MQANKSPVKLSDPELGIPNYIPHADTICKRDITKETK